MPGAAEFLTGIVKSRVAAGGWQWLQEACLRCNDLKGKADFQMDFSAASRFSGKDPLNLTSDELGAMSEITDLTCATWTTDEAARAMLLLECSQNSSHEESAKCIHECFRYSDKFELAALLKSLPLLPKPETFLHHAREACRSNIQDVFMAIAYDNIYPANFFSTDAFNQMVMKAFFMGIFINPILQLDETINEDLARMALDYMEEREAAGRAVPFDLWRVVAPATEPRVIPTLKKYLQHEDPLHRQAVAMSLTLSKNEQAKEMLTAALQREQNATTKEVIEKAVNHEIDWTILSEGV